MVSARGKSVVLVLLLAVVAVLLVISTPVAQAAEVSTIAKAATPTEGAAAKPDPDLKKARIKRTKTVKRAKSKRNATDTKSKSKPKPKPKSKIVKKVVPAGPIIPKANAKQFQTWNETVQWVRSHGGFVSDSIGVGLFAGAGGGWGLKALASIQSGETLLRVPDQLTLTVDRVLSAKPEWTPLTEALDDDGIIGLYLAVQRFHRHRLLVSSTSAHSLWDTYISSLSPVCINGEVLGRAAMKVLKPCTALHKRLVAKKKQRELEWSFIQGMVLGGEHAHLLGLSPHPNSPPAVADHDGVLSHVTLSQYAWGVCTKRSRSFDIGMIGKHIEIDAQTGEEMYRKEAALIPLADWANHSANKTATYRFVRPDSTDAANHKQWMMTDGSTGVFVLEAMRALPAGQQLTISYGRTSSNADLLMNFGFVIPHNHANDGVTISLWPATGPGSIGKKGINGFPNDPVKARIVRAMLGRAGTDGQSGNGPAERAYSLASSTVTIYRDGLSPVDLGLIRVALLNGTELSAYNVGRCLRSNLTEICVSPEHELRVVVWIADQLYSMLSKHTTLPAADVKIIRKLRRKARARGGSLKPQEQMRLIAVQYRLVEKLTLISFLKQSGAW